MLDGDAAAKRPRAVVPRRQGAKGAGSASQPRAKLMRVQLHLGVATAERLGVHATLSHRDKSRVADEILNGWLCRYGKGREVFEIELAEDLPPEDSGGRGGFPPAL